MNLEKRLKALRKRYKADKKKLIEEYLRDTSKRTVCAEDGGITVKRGSPEYIHLKGMQGKVREVDNKPLANYGFFEFDEIPFCNKNDRLYDELNKINVTYKGQKYYLVMGTYGTNILSVWREKQEP